MGNKPRTRAKFRGRRNTKGRKKKGCAKIHEKWAARVFDRAFWPVAVIDCAKCPKLKNRCKSCTKAFSKRAFYVQCKRRRWFDFDIALKVFDKASGEWKVVVVVEIDGPTHEVSVCINGAKTDISDQMLRDRNKQKYCERAGIFMVRIPCYFKRKMPDGTIKYMPNPARFVKLVHMAVWSVHDKLRSGDLGSAAARMLDRHWNPDWHRHPDSRKLT